MTESMEYIAELRAPPLHEQAHTVTKYDDSASNRMAKAYEEPSIIEQSVSSHHLQTHRQIADYRRRRNDQLPIFLLPNELLAKIMLLATPLKPKSTDSGRLGYIAQLMPLAQVCARFADVLFASPDLWAIADCRESPVTLDKALSRSKDAGLDVVLSGLVGSSKSFLHLVGQQSYRWSSLELSQLWSDLVTDIFKLPTPNLRDLTVSHNGHKGRSAIPDATFGPVAHLSLSGFNLIWNPNSVSGLRSLDLQDMGQNSPSKTALMTILRDSPGLTRLGIHRLNLTGSIEPNTGIVDLPYLKQLTMTGLLREDCDDILRSIRIPKCERLTLDCDLNSNFKPSPPTLNINTAHLESVISQILASCHKVTIKAFPGGIRCTSEDADLYYPFQLSGDEVVYLQDEYRLNVALRFSEDCPTNADLDMLRTSAAMFPRPNICLVMEIGLGPTELRLGPAPAITCLTFPQPAASVLDDWLKYISHPAEDGSWPLCNLKELALIGTPKDREVILEMVRCRYGNVSHRNENETPQISTHRRPVRLSFLAVMGHDVLDVQTRGELEALVGFAVRTGLTEEESRNAPIATAPVGSGIWSTMFIGRIPRPVAVDDKGSAVADWW